MLFHKHEELQPKLNKDAMQKVSCCLIPVNFEQVWDVSIAFKNMRIRLYQVNNIYPKSKNAKIKLKIMTLVIFEHSQEISLVF